MAEFADCEASGSNADLRSVIGNAGCVSFQTVSGVVISKGALCLPSFFCETAPEAEAPGLQRDWLLLIGHKQ